VKLVVIDTGVLVAGIYWRREPHRCVRGWLRGLFIPVVTQPIFLEYERVLREVKAEQHFTTDLEPWLIAIRHSGYWVAPHALGQTVCRDPNDDLMIEAALASGARTIIARDPDLAILKKPFGIQILTPRAWLASLSRADRRRLD